MPSPKAAWHAGQPKPKEDDEEEHRHPNQMVTTIVGALLLTAVLGPAAGATPIAYEGLTGRRRTLDDNAAAMTAQ